MLRILLAFLLSAQAVAAGVVSLNIDTNDAVIGWLPGHLREEDSVRIVIIDASDFERLSKAVGGASNDDLLVPLWRWTGKGFEHRAPEDITVDRRKVLMPELAAARDALRSARELQKEEPDVVTDEDLKALQVAIDKIKDRMK